MMLYIEKAIIFGCFNSQELNSPVSLLFTGLTFLED